VSLRIHAKVFSTFFRDLAQDSHPTLVMMRTKLDPKQTLPETADSAIVMTIAIHAIAHDCHGYVISRDDLGEDFEIVSEIAYQTEIESARERAINWCKAHMIVNPDDQDLYHARHIDRRPHEITWDDEYDIEIGNFNNYYEESKCVLDTGANGTVNIRKGR